MILQLVGEYGPISHNRPSKSSKATYTRRRGSASGVWRLRFQRRLGGFGFFFFVGAGW